MLNTTVKWSKENLFSSPLNVLLTLFSIYLFYLIIPPAFQWLIWGADWSGSAPEDCSRQAACWVTIKENFGFLMYGFYPAEETWRPNSVGIGFVLLISLFFVKAISQRKKIYLAAFLVLIYPMVVYAVLHGEIFGIQFFDKVVSPHYWGGFMLTILLSVIGIAASLPLGIILALGRRSEMPIISRFCVIFIEIWRGVPLITVLFMASVMLPLFFPDGTNFEKLSRAVIGITIFQSAYMAEVVRGGLQAIPRGQFEAADALGLNYFKKMVFIVLPQALKLVIPGIVNTFITLFKDTSLVSIIGMMDLLNSALAVGTSPQWLQFPFEPLVFAAIVYGISCYSMSKFSQYLERKLNTSHKN